ncbi:Sugar transferase involved in LPS biosynthesis (colanic, teichoic acid) [Psychroflexus salarius]|uniref:Sugar transferase involved in LPS biosynthesis (Colanic, teichoic acid) n=1 Tax=Psychroflexus salarius TaxID=1155689 RepID=A0A1M4V6C0_9FLAO|nr:sugar transferase [Psychroflexus salarius]SHE64515.1 Sugar transferase involved in LPS biosynthesis (colanic, teichoic acid) [Psychroflexus salarius]
MKNSYKNILKPLIDFTAALLGVLILSPVLLIVAILLTLQNKGTPFFFQTRPGKDQKAFQIIKFKTMTDEKDKDGNLLPDVKRITSLGKVIRKLSIDELPQLINVLKGDMSLVGPRPLLFKYIPLFSKTQLRRHEVRPGITGWAQVNGRNSISWTRKFELDVEYVDRISIGLDIKILYLTVLKVVKSEGVNQSEARPMQPFDGTN